MRGYGLYGDYHHPQYLLATGSIALPCGFQALKHPFYVVAVPQDRHLPQEWTLNLKDPFLKALKRFCRL